jgi:hypothetical protein
MNQWVENSIELANSPGYLDRLHEVYPVTREAEREIPPQVQEALRAAYERHDNFGLLRLLLKLERFPIKDPYVAFLRKKPHFPEYNPKTVDRIAETLYANGFEKMIEGAQTPKEFNTQIGPLFKKWLPTLGYPYVTAGYFLQHIMIDHMQIAFLKGSDKELLELANEVLGCNLPKAPDLIARAGEHFFVGEAKFITDTGGHQSGQFADALRLLQGREGTAKRIAVMDGVVWIKGGAKMFRTVSTLEDTALSALLLRDFLESQV